MAKIGDAHISLNIDISAMSGEINQAMNVVDEATRRIRDAFNVKPETSGYDKVKDSVKGVGESADRSAQDVKQLGDEGDKSINKLLRFEVVEGAIEGLKRAFSEMSEFVIDSTNAFADADLVVEKLRGGLTSLGDVDSLDRLLQQASDLEGITPFDGDDITNMQSLLTTFQLNGEAIEKLTPAMLDLSSAFARAGDTGMDLEQVAILFGKAVGADFVSALTRVGIVMTDNQMKMLEMSKGMERVSIFLDIMRQNSSLTAEAFGKTLAGQIQSTEVAIGNLKETLGKQFAPIVITVGEAIKNFVKIFESLPGVVQGAVAGIILLSIAITELIAVMIVFDVTTGGLLILLGAIVTGLAGLVVIVGANIDAVEDLVTELVGGQEAFDELKVFAGELLEMFEDMWAFISQEFMTLFNDLIDIFVDLVGQFGETMGGSDDLLGTIKMLVEEGFSNLMTIVTNVIDIIKDLILEIANTISNNASLNTSLHDSGGAWKVFEGFVEFAINTLLRFMDIAKRTIVSIGNLVSALQALKNISLIDLVTNPGRFEANLNQLKNAVQNIGEEMTKEFRPIDVNFSSNNNIDPNEFLTPEQRQKMVQSNNQGKDNNDNNNQDKPPGGSKGSKGSTKKEDPFKQENESLKELLATQDRQLSNIEKQIKLNEDNADVVADLMIQRQGILETYIGELQSLLQVVGNKDNQVKIEDKILDLQLQQQKTEKDIAEQQKKNNELIADVDAFLQKRQLKTLGSAEQETLAIENAYAKMEQKITDSKLAQSEQRTLIDKLEAEKKMELDRVKMENDLALDEELNLLRLQAENDTIAMEVLAINQKYDAERERILLNYEEGKKRSELLALLEHKRAEELAKAQIEILQIASDSLKNTFDNAVTQLGNAVGNMFDSVFGEAKNLVTDFIRFFIVELTKLAATKVFKLIFDFLSGGIFGGIFGVVGAVAAGISGGGRAEGGAVKKGVPYIVGEEGMEMFVPTQDGFIVPNPMTEDFLNRSDTINKLLYDYTSNTIPEIPSVSLSGVGQSVRSGGGVSVAVGDVSIPIEVKRLSGLDQNEWDRIVDEELLPQISGGLKRAGMNVLDDSLKH